MELKDSLVSAEMIATVAGVLSGFGLSVLNDIVRRWRRGRAHWGALRAEIDVCHRKAETYLRDRVKAPLYRLPTTAYSQSFPVLLGDAAVAEGEVVSLIEFFTEVESLNRGLDLAQTARERDDNKMLDDEYQRNRLKAGKLTPPPTGSDNYYTRARAVVDAHAPKLPTSPPLSRGS